MTSLGVNLQNDLALLSFGNPLRGDDAVADYIVNQLPEELRAKFTYYNLESKSCFIRDCIRNYEAAIFIDAVQVQSCPGTCHIVNLNQLILSGQKLNIRCSHSFSWLDELMLLSLEIELPITLYFFGIEIDESDFANKISASILATKPQIIHQLSQLIQKTLNGNKVHA